METTQAPETQIPGQLTLFDEREETEKETRRDIRRERRKAEATGPPPEKR